MEASNDFVLLSGPLSPLCKPEVLGLRKCEVCARGLFLLNSRSPVLLPIGRTASDHPRVVRRCSFKFPAVPVHCPSPRPKTPKKAEHLTIAWFLAFCTSSSARSARVRPGAAEQQHGVSHCSWRGAHAGRPHTARRQQRPAQPGRVVCRRWVGSLQCGVQQLARGQGAGGALAVVGPG